MQWEIRAHALALLFLTHATQMMKLNEIYLYIYYTLGEYLFHYIILHDYIYFFL